MLQKFNKINSLLILAAFIIGLFMFPYIGNAGHDDLGHYGCFDRDRRTHVNCLRSLLHQHAPHLAEGAAVAVPPMGDPGMNPRQVILMSDLTK